METDKAQRYFPRRVSILRPGWGFLLLLLVTPYAGPRLPPAPPGGEVGIASWYGPRFHGRRTANGEVFDMHHLSAAHPTLPLGSWVEVANLDNGRSIPLRVNDRGPFIAGRIIDVSYAAARSLGMVKKGLARVHLRPLQAPPVRLVAQARRRDSTIPGRSITSSFGGTTDRRCFAKGPIAVSTWTSCGATAASKKCTSSPSGRASGMPNTPVSSGSSPSLGLWRGRG